MTSGSYPSAILWDLDGTIVDTEPYWMSAEGELVEKYGGSWTHSDAMALVGSGLWNTAQTMQRHGVQLEEDAIVDALTDRVMQQISAAVPWRPGALELLEEIRHASIPTAMVTMSISRMAELVCSLIPFDCFDYVVSGEDVSQPKPHPEPYLVAANLLGVEAQECVAFEDSIAGVTSAAAAGVFTIGVPHYLDLDKAPAHVLWQSLETRKLTDITQAYAQYRGFLPQDFS